MGGAGLVQLPRELAARSLHKTERAASGQAEPSSTWVSSSVLSCTGTAPSMPVREYCGSCCCGRAGREGGRDGCGGEPAWKAGHGGSGGH